MFTYTMAEISYILKQSDTPLPGSNLIPEHQIKTLLNNAIIYGSSGGHDNLPIFEYITDTYISVTYNSRCLKFPIDSNLISLGFNPNLIDYANIKFERYNCLMHLPVVNSVHDIISYIKGKGLQSSELEIKKSLTNLLKYNVDSSLGCVEFKIIGSSRPIFKIKTYSGWIQIIKVIISRTLIEEIILLDRELADY